MAARPRSVAALMARVGPTTPLAIPGMIVGRIDAPRHETAFRNRRAAFLCSPQQPRELDRQVLALRPPGPVPGIDLKIHAVKIQSITLWGDFISHRSWPGQAQPTHGVLLLSRSKASPD